MSLRLDQLLQGITSAPALPLADLVLDSRRVVPGAAFVALPGHNAHGLAFAAEALRRGANSILFEPPLPQGMQLPPSAIAVPSLRTQLGRLADRFHGSPSVALRVVGVTGTNGKTSTVQLLAQALSLQGRCAGSIGTLGVGLNGAVRAGERTTPDVISVHAALATLRDEGAQDVAMEVSSHALDQGRVDAVRFQIAVFTNLTRDHLDYHQTMEAYGAAKARLFAWPGLGAAVINLDDAFGAHLQAGLPSDVLAIGVSSRGAAGASLRADNIRLHAAGVDFDLLAGDSYARVSSRLLGRFNVDNLLAVAGVLIALEWPLEQIAASLVKLEPVPGRMQRLGGDVATPLVVIDYAHTPDALEQTLRSLRQHTNGRLICVFGCGGERDAGKRPQMAAIAQALADHIVVSDDNPRGEDGDAIVADIIAGFTDRSMVRIERDRGQAIAAAIGMAQPGDTVLVAGKGHEPYQEVGGVKHSFDDREVARHVLERRA